MKHTILFLIFPLLCNLTFAQNKAEAEKLVDEGVAYHDKGDYEGAIARYNKALELDKDNMLAMTEKAMSLVALRNYDDAITVCKKTIDKHPGDPGLQTLYVSYGNALDGLKKTDKSVEIYDEGIKLFPNYYQLHFNKGISLASVKKYDQALLSFEQAVMLNPNHASSHNAIARLSDANNKRIPAFLAYCRFLAIEPEGDRATANLAFLQKLVKGNVEQKDKSVTINISMDMLDAGLKDGKAKENNFSSTDLILAMSSGLDLQAKGKDISEVKRFTEKLKTVCASLSETKKNNFGFYWAYYVPYFIEMKDKNLLETFAYIAFASSDDPDTSKWLKDHNDEVGKFFEWSKSFEWKMN